MQDVREPARLDGQMPELLLSLLQGLHDLSEGRKASHLFWHGAVVQSVFAQVQKLRLPVVQVGSLQSAPVAFRPEVWRIPNRP